MKIAAILMASGFSRRMGKEKLLLPYKNRPMVEHVLQAIREAGVTEENILVAVNTDILTLGETQGFLGIRNRESMVGQSASIRLGIEAAPDADAYMFFAGDQPLISAQLIRAMAEKADPRHILVASYRGKEGLPTLFPAMYREALRKVHGDHGGRQIKENNRGYIVHIEATERDMVDVDTLEDYRQLQGME